MLLSLLWTRAYARRPETLRTANRFVANPALTERTLLADVLPAGPPAVDVDDEDWRTDLAAALQARGTSRLVSTSGATPALAQAIRELMVDPLEVNWLHVLSPAGGNHQGRRPLLGLAFAPGSAAMSTRLIHRLAAAPTRDITECLEGLFLCELLNPGQRLLVVSPWMSDFPALNNRGGKFAVLDASWTASYIPFSRILRALLQRGVYVQIACGPGAPRDGTPDPHRAGRIARRDREPPLRDQTAARASPVQPRESTDQRHMGGVRIDEPHLQRSHDERGTHHGHDRRRRGRGRGDRTTRPVHVSPAQRDEAWSDFTRAFFSPPNDLSPAADETTGKIIAWAREAWLRSPASPFFLPVSASGWTYWYAICPDQEQRLWVRDLIRAYLGSWVSFSGQPVAADSDLPLDQAVRALDRPGRLLVPAAGTQERQCRDQRPPERDPADPGTGGTALSPDSPDLAAGQAHQRLSPTPAHPARNPAAEETLALLEQDHRLSGANKLFLRLQYLAAFARWTDLEESGHLPDLIRLNRPVLASDALARLVMARLPATASLARFRRVSMRSSGAWSAPSP